MTKKEWKEHCEWLDTFRAKIVTNNEVYKNYGEDIKKKKKPKKKDG
jgi:hypothetical protein